MRWVPLGMFCIAAVAGAQAPSGPLGGKPEVQANAQTTVTFYSGGSLWKAALSGAKTGTFQGCIFEGNSQLACLSWRMYAVVKLAPGPHVFSASLSSKHGAENSQTSILLEAGKSYYLRAEQETSKIDPVHVAKGRLDIVSCEVAERETVNSAPAGTKLGLKDWKRRPRDGAPQCAVSSAAIGNPSSAAVSKN